MNRGAWSSETKIVPLLLITYSDKEIVVVIVLKDRVFAIDFYFNFEIITESCLVIPLLIIDSFSKS